MMFKSHTVDCIYTNTAGETTCFVVGGLKFPTALTIGEKRAYAERKFDWIRSSVMKEPRGHHDLYGGMLVPAHSPEADYGILWMDGDGFADMCGHGTIALSMLLQAQGWIEEKHDSLNTVCLETTIGNIHAEVSHSMTQVNWSQFVNVPAFVVKENIPVTLPEVGAVLADIVFAGVFFGVIRWPEASPVRIGPDKGRYFGEMGLIAKRALHEQVDPKHPVYQAADPLDIVTFYHEPSSADAFYRCVHTYRNGKADRSPGGTGTSAMLALLQHRGRISPGQTIRAEGLLGGAFFDGCIVGETRVGDYKAIVPRIRATSEIVAVSRLTLDRNDSISMGYDVT